jgi:CHASE2 domain-containing sensor protein
MNIPEGPEPGAPGRGQIPPSRRLRDALARSLLNPGATLVWAPFVALLLAGLSRLPPWQRIDGPLLDIVTSALPDTPEAEQLYVVDLARWVERDMDPATSLDRNAAPRAEQRREIARVVRALHDAGARVIALDIELEDPTEDDADLELARALHDADAVVARRLERANDSGDWHPHELHAPFADLAWGAVNIGEGPDRVTRYYGVRGHVHESLAAVVARRLDPQLVPPKAPLLLRVPASRIDERQLDESLVNGLTRSRRLSVTELLARESDLANVAPAFAWLVGVSGRAGVLVDGRIVVSPAGDLAVPGVELHAEALGQMSAGRVVVEGGFLAMLVPVLVMLAATAALAALALRAATRRNARRPTAVPLVAAGLMSLLALPVATLAAIWAGVTTSPLALLSAPVGLLLASRAGAWASRRVQLRVGVAPRLGAAPEALRQSIESAFMEAEPLARLQRTLTAYEDLLHWAAVLLLTTRPLPRKSVGTIRDAWHSQHTLQTVLAAFNALDPKLGADVLALSRLDDDPAGRESLRASLRMIWRAPDAPELVDFMAATSREKYRNAFVLLRNALAHDTAAWIDDTTAARACLVLQRQLVRILALDGMSDLLHGHRLETTWTREGVPTDFVAPRLSSALPGGADASLAPWILGRAQPGERRMRLYRYRGLSDRADWPTDDAGGVVKMVACTEHGLTGAGFPERILIPLRDVVDTMPPAIRPEATK